MSTNYTKLKVTVAAVLLRISVATAVELAVTVRTGYFMLYRQKSDTFRMRSSGGSLRWQDYVDFTYFAEDYIGGYRTFGG